MLYEEFKKYYKMTYIPRSLSSPLLVLGALFISAVQIVDAISSRCEEKDSELGNLILASKTTLNKMFNNVSIRPDIAMKMFGKTISDPELN
jgi:hypothetical protein